MYQSYWTHTRGNVAMILGLLLPVLLGLVGGGVDYYVYSKHEKTLQEVADVAALAAAREASMQGWDEQLALSVALSYVDTNLRENGQADREFSTDVDVDEAAGKVTVTIDQDEYKYFLIGYFKDSPQIRVNATAVSTGQTSNTCVIGLHTNRRQTIGLRNQSRITAADCAIYSNSVHTNGLSVLDRSTVLAQLSCSSGGYQGPTRNYQIYTGTRSYSERPLTDCPQLDDPLEGRLPPRPSSLCIETAKLILTGRHTLRPGTYCGGLGISGDAEVTFTPGTYIIKDGPMIVSGNAKVTGRDVAFYFTGEFAIFEYVDMAEVSFEAPRSGPLAGLLIMQDPSSPYYDDDDNAKFGIDWNGQPENTLSPFVSHCREGHGNQNPELCSTQHASRRGIVLSTDQPIPQPPINPVIDISERLFNWTEWPSDLNDFRITSDFAQNLLGTIYLPQADLVIDARQDVAGQSDYTAIVVQRLILKDGPNLVLNANYDRTSVPVPEGLGPVSAQVRLSQ